MVFVLDDCDSRKEFKNFLDSVWDLINYKYLFSIVECDVCSRQDKEFLKLYEEVHDEKKTQ